ncbi:uncharacterized protein PF11_0207-like [Pseudomyrmex gracilis]|uniref:uncharacterized protein PF11_0207-like n=1 Tax=Pseudomyrmex gracilis TaxID=219809 RepID=UPI000995CA95|nr:uncharacterized protein PF11_0207-like [Pseudomyrmex gracilis]
MERKVREKEARERNRSASKDCIEDFLKKRKREEGIGREGKEEGGAFNKSRKTLRSPDGKEQKDKEEEENKECAKRGVVKGEMEREIKEWKEEMKEMARIMLEGMKDIREIKEQGKSMKEELEGLRRDIREKEEK